MESVKIDKIGFYKIVRGYNVYEVFYKRDGLKKSKLFVSKKDANRFKSKLHKNRRKYMGTREVVLSEVKGQL